MKIKAVGGVKRHVGLIRTLRMMRLLREPHTHLQLAAKLGVCKRTVIRDLDVLREVGVPIAKTRKRWRLRTEYWVELDRAERRAS